MDKNYCLITVKSSIIKLSLFIIVDAYRQHICQINFHSISSNRLFNLINKHCYISRYISFSHTLYLGKEIYKAQLSNSFQQKYIQL